MGAPPALSLPASLSIALLAHPGFSSRPSDSCGLVRSVTRELAFAKPVNLLSDSARAPSRCALAQRLDDGVVRSRIFLFDLIYQRDSMRIRAIAALKLFGPQRRILKKDED
jgi:hypothetical protein